MLSFQTSYRNSKLNLTLGMRSADWKLNQPSHWPFPRPWYPSNIYVVLTYSVPNV